MPGTPGEPQRRNKRVKSKRWGISDPQQANADVAANIGGNPLKREGCCVATTRSRSPDFEEVYDMLIMEAGARSVRSPAPLAADLAGRNPSPMFVGGGALAALAAKRSTSTIPIVFAIGSDPVKMGLVAALNRPGGNVTGVTFLLNALVAKRLEHPTNPNARSDVRDVQNAARTLRLRTNVAVDVTSGSAMCNACGQNAIATSFASSIEVLCTPGITGLAARACRA